MAPLADWKTSWRIVSVVILLAIFTSHSATAQFVETGFLNRTVSVSGQDYRYQVYVPAAYSREIRWPVILYLHGAGERGSDGLFQTAIGLGAALRANVSRFPAIIVFPQAPKDSVWAGIPADVAMAALQRTQDEFSTDSARVYLTGLSMGGNGAWSLAYRFPGRFAAVAPICGWVVTGPSIGRPSPVVALSDSEAFQALAHRLKDVPIWIFHGEMDPVVSVEESRKAAAALRASGGDVRYTELLGIGHNAWDPAYASTEFINWLFRQRR
jgi:predicted peptidase